MRQVKQSDTITLARHRAFTMLRIMNQAALTYNEKALRHSIMTHIEALREELESQVGTVTDTVNEYVIRR